MKETVSSERTINSTEIKKDSDKEIEDLYEYAITTGKIKRDLYSLNDFMYNYKSSLEYYPELQKVLNLQESFEEWFEQINFGALPDGQGEAYPDDNFKNINKRNFDTRAFSNAQKKKCRTI